MSPLNHYVLLFTVPPISRLRLLPKCLQDVSKMDLSANILGWPTSMPVGVAPTAYHKLAHSDGEVATARAAEKAGVIFTLSSLSSCSIEDIAKAAPTGVKWLQLYIFNERSVTERLIKRAEKSGFKAIVLTVDSPTRPIIYNNQRNAFDIPSHIRPVNLLEPGQEGPRSEFDRSLTWNDVKWLVGFTELPVIAKGVMRSECALKAIESGCKAVWVSNHGGRLVDTTPAPVSNTPW